MKPCPECGKALEADPEWQFCPFCGTALDGDSDVAAWRWIATYETLGEGAYIGDELKRRGIPSRLREETTTRPPYFVVQAQYVQEVAADKYDEAAETILALRKRDAVDENLSEPDVPPSQSASRTVVFTATVTWLLVVVAMALLGIVMGLASLAER
ncbi:MAG TPA: zinc ribbon domain-containing protein [Pirellulaceae bacterium]|jgi:hypothetical protein|nr:zinc ribbon domain-containing protein [Pirellulaceae bacterium]